MTPSSQRYPTPRRLYLALRQSTSQWDAGLAGVWRAKQEAQPGTPLPATFPALTTLSTAGYTTIEDLNGADEAELVAAGLALYDAKAVLAAFLTL